MQENTINSETFPFLDKNVASPHLSKKILFSACILRDVCFPKYLSILIQERAIASS